MSNFQRWTSKFEIKPGSWVFVPTPESILSGRRIKAAIEELWTPPKNYFHLRNGGHVAALNLHRQNKCFIHLDIRDFFGSINKTRVTRCLRDDFGYKSARCVAHESTVKHPENIEKFILPFGFVQSPIIASICLHQSKLGKVLHKISRTENISVSVYMDDIVISFIDPSQAPATLLKIKEAAERSKFDLNEKKEEGPAERITSFNIELSQGNTVISDKRFEKFHQDFYAAETNDHQKKGYKNYIKSVNPEQAKFLT